MTLSSPYRGNVDESNGLQVLMISLAAYRASYTRGESSGKCWIKYNKLTSI